MHEDASFPGSGLAVRHEGLLLRPWTTADVPQMVELFDTDEMDRWTPLPHPFDQDAATTYVHNAQQALSDGVLQLAVLGGSPCAPALCEGSGHRGHE